MHTTRLIAPWVRHPPSPFRSSPVAIAADHPRRPCTARRCYPRLPRGRSDPSRPSSIWHFPILQPPLETPACVRTRGTRNPASRSAGYRVKTRKPPPRSSGSPPSWRRCVPRAAGRIVPTRRSRGRRRGVRSTVGGNSRAVLRCRNPRRRRCPSISRRQSPTPPSRSPWTSARATYPPVRSSAQRRNSHPSTRACRGDCTAGT